MSVHKLPLPNANIPILGQGPKPNEKLVQTLEALLAQARSGDLVGFAFAGQRANGCATLGISPGDANLFVVLGAIDLVHNGVRSHIEHNVARQAMAAAEQGAPPEG